MDIQVFAQRLLLAGWEKKVSDVYLLPQKERLMIYFRSQDQRQVFAELKKEAGGQLIRHFKFLAHMDIAEKRKPQLGAFTSEVKGEKVRLRISSVGDYLGEESLVLRFFQKNTQLQKNYLLFEKDYLLTQIQRRGLHLFVGPTGSGKTTLMYQLAKEQKNFQQIITIEDPVEIEEDSFLQLQTNSKIGLNYEALIKVCLRHRPDCLIIGEIRDEETCQMVLRAALTGHVVLATLHGKNLPEIFLRLEELGLSKSQIEKVIQTITFQRMVTVPCKFCQEKKQFCETCQQGCLVSVYPKESFAKKLRKAWAYGFISKDSYKKEKD